MPIRHNALGSIPTETDRTFITLTAGDTSTASCSVHENVLNRDAVVPWHSHAVEEVIVCLSGEGECTFQGNQPERYRAGSVLVIPPDTVHTLRNVGSGLLTQLAVLGGVQPMTRWIASEGSVQK